MHITCFCFCLFICYGGPENFCLFFYHFQSSLATICDENFFLSQLQFGSQNLFCTSKLKHIFKIVKISKNILKKYFKRFKLIHYKKPECSRCCHKKINFFVKKNFFGAPVICVHATKYFQVRLLVGLARGRQKTRGQRGPISIIEETPRPS